MNLLEMTLDKEESLHDFLHGAEKSNRKSTKIINTRVPVEVVKQFKLYCALNNIYKKEAYREMLEYFLEKYADEQIQMQNKIVGEDIDFNHLETTNFEIDKELIPKLDVLSVLTKCSLKDLYCQIIVQYFNDKKIEIRI